MLENICRIFFDAINRLADGNTFTLSDEQLSLNSMELLKQLDERVRSLKQCALPKGSIIYVTSGRGVRYWIDLLSTWSSGHVFVPIDPLASKDTLENYLKIAPPALVLADQGFFDKNPFLQVNGGLFPVVGHGEQSINFEDIHAPDDTAAILFTSGSTGVPKGVALSFKSVVGNTCAVLKRLPIKNSDRLYVNTPEHFTSAISHFLASFLIGCHFISDTKKRIGGDLISQINIFKATCYGGSPIQLKWLLDNVNELSVPIRWVMSSGDHLPTNIILGLQSKFPALEVVTVYGLTEVGGRFCILSQDHSLKYQGTVGYPIDGLMYKICDERGANVPVGEIGEVVISGDFLFSGYLRNQKATSKALKGNRFFTGDVGRITVGDTLELLGRKDDVVKIAGQKVSFNTLRAILMGMEVFEDLAIVPVHHKLIGLVPYAVVQLIDDRDVSLGSIRKFLRDKVSSIEVPQGFSQVDQLARTGSGKIDRRKLRSQVEECLAGDKMLSYRDWKVGEDD